MSDNYKEVFNVTTIESDPSKAWVLTSNSKTFRFGTKAKAFFDEEVKRIKELVGDDNIATTGEKAHLFRLCTYDNTYYVVQIELNTIEEV